MCGIEENHLGDKLNAGWDVLGWVVKAGKKEEERRRESNNVLMLSLLGHYYK